MFMAVQEVSDSMFQTYVIALGVSGILLLLTALIGFGATAGSRIISALVGLAFLGYGIYLEFFLADGATFSMYFYAFIVPILVIINVFRSRKAKKEAVGTPPAA